MVIREPIQSLESWIRSDFEGSNYVQIISKITDTLYGVNSPNFGIHNSVAVRLEDIKLNSKVTLGKLCSWMGIDDHDALYNMTAQGLRWWGDPTSPDYHEDGMNPFGRVSLEREVGEIFSEKDQFILRTLFYPFNVQFGYEKIDEHAFIKKSDGDTSTY